MLDPALLRGQLDATAERLATRGFVLDKTALEAIESERKTKNGGLSTSQVAFGEFIHAQGYATVVAYSWLEAKEAIEAYLGGREIPFFWVPEVSYATC